MTSKGRHLSWKAGKENAKILVEALYCFAYGDLDSIPEATYLKTNIKYRWEEKNLWVTKATLDDLSNLTEQHGQKLEKELIRNALHCLKALSLLEDKRGESNSKTKTSSPDWNFVLKLKYQEKQENLYWLFGRKDGEGEWECLKNNEDEASQSNLQKTFLPVANSIDIPLCPYRGLYAFQEEDADFFFGRDIFIKELVTAVQKKPLVTVIGRSGSGKSSVIFAGLIPKLRQQGYWLFANFRPENRPLYNLARQLNKLLIPQWERKSQHDQRKETRKLANDLRDDDNALQDVIADILSNQHSTRLLLVVDQFEELYTISPEDERQPFLDQLLRTIQVFSAKQIPDLVVVLTLRDDFVGHALDSSLGEALQKFKTEFLYAMTREQLQEAIEKPAAKRDVIIEDCLTERILDAVVGEPGILPCMEFALTQLWESLKSSNTKNNKLLLNHRAYMEIGGVEKALANHAECVFEELDDDRQQQVKQIFIQLVNFGEKTQDTRRLATRTQVGENNWDLVKYLADKRLVVTGRDEVTKEKTVEVVHEALIRGWDSLRLWMEENHKFRTWQEHLRIAIERWKAINHDEGGLLQKALLAEAEDWLKTRSDEITSNEKEFIKKSREYEDRGRKFQEELRIKAVFSEINALVSLSQSEISLSHQLEALVAAVKAGRKLQEVESPTEEMKRRTVDVLQQVIDGIQERNRLKGHDDRVFWVTLSPDGKTIASASADKTVKLWSLDGALLRTFEEQKDGVYGLSFSPDGKTIAFANEDRTVKLWGIDGKLLQTFSDHREIVNKVCFSPDGDMLASASDDRTVKLWTLDGTLLQTLEHDDMAYGVSFSPDGKTIASASLDKTIKLWQLDGTLMQTFTGHSISVNNVNFSSDSQMLVSASADKTIKLWKSDGELVRTLEGHEKEVLSVCFSPDDQYIVSASNDRTVRLWRVDGSLIQVFQGHNEGVTAASFSPDGKTIVTASNDRTIRLWEINKRFLQHDDDVRSVNCDSSGKEILTASDDGTVRLWNIDGTLSKTFQNHTDRVNYASFIFDEELIVSSSTDRTVKIFHQDGTVLKAFNHEDSVNNISFSYSNQVIATSSPDKKIRFWQLNGILKNVFDAHSDRIWCVSFSPDGNTLASASSDKTIKLWDLDSRLIRTYTGHQDRVLDVSFSFDGKKLVSASRDRKVILWDIEGSIINEFEEHSDAVNSATFSPDGSMIASASNDKTVKVWGIDGTLLRTFQGHKDTVTDVIFTPSCQLLVSASRDRTVRIWRLDGTEGNLDIDSQLNNLLLRSFNWLKDYLNSNPNIAEEIRH
ncbi:MAG: AAA family ATPase [Cyanobacteria bacterium P01_C01_bin.38]